MTPAAAVPGNFPDHRLSALGMLQVREVHGAEQLRACQHIQRRAWGITEDGYLVPVATMAGAQQVGGSVLGAYLGERLVGFSFAFLGRLRGQPVLYSQLTAVEPELQARGIGRQLKLEQRRVAARLGVDAIVWAFDALQAGNAAFNLAVLGATSRIYEVNLYGSRSDALNAGLDTDRLLAEWPVSPSPGASPEGTRQPMPASDPPDLIAVGPEPQAPHVLESYLGRPRLRLSIPADLRAVKAVDGGRLARAWQLAVRHAFQAAFALNYVAVGFARGPAPAYLLERQP
jgi:predicted GNAT superfamily acetyltransferase